MSARQRQVAEQLGRRVAALRLQRGWSRRRLARECGLSDVALGNIESGEGALLSSVVLIADAFGVPVPAMLTEPSCQACGDRPPAGYTCNQCSAGGEP